MQGIVLFILFIMGVINHLNPKDKWGMNHQIKYDLHDKKIIFLVALSSIGIMLLMILTICLPIDKFCVGRAIGDGLMVLLTFWWPLVIAVWANYLDCVFYLKRLRRNGYELPERKKDYGKRISSLCRNTDKIKNAGAVSQDSIILAVISWIVAVGLLLRAIAFWIEFQLVKDVTWICMIFFGVILLCWIVVGGCYFYQRLNSKFRDDVEPGRERKIRVHLIAGLGFIVFCLFLSNIGIFFMDQGMRYVMNAREQAQQEEYIEGEF